MRCVRFVVAAALVLSACAGSESERRPGSSTSGAAGAGGSTGFIDPTSSGGSMIGSLDASLPPLHGTVKSDGGDMLTVSGAPATVQFHVTLDDGSQPHIVWSVDDTRIGSIGADGVFHAKQLQAKCASKYAPQKPGAPANGMPANEPAKSMTQLQTGNSSGISN